jgi:hypothetical protein
VIERLATTLRTLAALPPAALRAPDARRLAADCADALRLQLDCPQQELTQAQRRVLRRLGDLLDADPPAAELPGAAAAACAALGLAVPPSHQE